MGNGVTVNRKKVNNLSYTSKIIRPYGENKQAATRRQKQ